MKDRISFVVPGDPVPQPRQRYRVVRGRVMNYTPKKHPIWAYKAAAAAAARDALPAGWKPDGPLGVLVTFVVPRPLRLSAKKFPGRVWADVRPDTDNYVKGLFDGVNKVVWADDAQVVELAASKLHAAPGEAPHTLVTVVRLG